MFGSKLQWKCVSSAYCPCDDGADVVRSRRSVVDVVMPMGDCDDALCCIALPPHPGCSVVDVVMPMGDCDDALCCIALPPHPGRSVVDVVMPMGDCDDALCCIALPPQPAALS